MLMILILDRHRHSKASQIHSNC